MLRHLPPRARLLGALATALLLTACDDGGGAGVADKLTGPPSFGKSDAPFGVIEAGRFARSGQVTGTLDGRNVEAWRFNAWPGTRVRVTLSSPDLALDPYLLIDGPIPSAPGEIVAYNDDDPGCDTLDSVIELTITEPGAYRILAGSYGAIYGEGGGAGAYSLDFSCLEGCEMPQITLAELLAGIEAELGREGALEALRAAVPTLFPDADAAQVDAVLTQVEAVLDNPGAVEQFPVVPLALAGTAQAFFESPEPAVEPPGPVHFQVEEILTQGCVAKRSELKPVHPLIPGLTTGSVANYAIDECALQRWQDFAEVLNNLALDNGSSVSYAGQRYDSIEAVVRALLAAGHHITITNDRFFADFLGLYYRGAAVIAPLWLETTIPRADGAGALAIPSPHTHHTIVVEGPLVNAELMFYMGVSGGTSFRAVGNLRSPWTGRSTRYTYDSDSDPEAVVSLLVTAGELRKKWTAEAAGLPAGGYGTLGVCNDSTGVLEMKLEGSATIFPFAHPPIAPDQAQDAIDDLLARIPADLSGYDGAEALSRVRMTLPYDDLSAMPFPEFKAQLDALLR